MDLPLPAFKFFADLSVAVDVPQQVGRTPRGVRRLIPILGGEVTGDGWRGKIRPGGADFQLLVGDTMAELDARYIIETDAGELIYVTNRAVRSGSPETMARLARGEPVDPSAVYFRCSPSFETSSERLAWIHERMFIGTGVRQPDRVVIRLWEVA